jgi:hypothetical protein
VFSVCAFVFLSHFPSVLIIPLILHSSHEDTYLLLNYGHLYGKKKVYST